MGDNKVLRRYRLREIAPGETVFFGDAMECAHFLGFGSAQAFHVACTRARERSTPPLVHYLVVEPVEEGGGYSSDEEAILAWDDLTSRLRHQYGVPKYSPKGAHRNG